MQLLYCISFWFWFQSKHDKVLVAVSGCFSSTLAVSDTELEHKEEDVLEMNSEDRYVSSLD